MKDRFIMEYDNDTGQATVLGFYDEEGNMYMIEGECTRCGQCCNSRCNHLIKETIDGKEIYSCSIYQMRPMICGTWPTNVQDLSTNPKCGYRIIKIE